MAKFKDLKGGQRFCTDDDVEMVKLSDESQDIVNGANGQMSSYGAAVALGHTMRGRVHVDPGDFVYFHQETEVTACA